MMYRPPGGTAPGMAKNSLTPEVASVARVEAGRRLIILKNQ